jgi:hypothetical protein
VLFVAEERLRPWHRPSRDKRTRTDLEASKKKELDLRAERSAKGDKLPSSSKRVFSA